MSIVYGPKQKNATSNAKIRENEQKQHERKKVRALPKQRKNDAIRDDSVEFDVVYPVQLNRSAGVSA